MTGDMGFVGTETKKVCERDGIKVIGYDLMNGFDIRDAAQLAAIINHWKPDRILHLAAIARFSDADADPMLANDTNVIGSINVAAAAGANHRSEENTSELQSQSNLGCRLLLEKK